MKDWSRIKTGKENVRSDAEIIFDAQSGNPKYRKQAFSALIEKHIGLVLRIAASHRRYNLPFDDLVSEGCLGLIRAAEKFDFTRGNAFSTYAACWIKQAMRRAWENQKGTIRIPCHSTQKLKKIKSVSAKLKQKTGREPTDLEIGRELGLSEKIVRNCKTFQIKTISLETLGRRDDGYPDANIPSPPDPSAKSPAEIMERKEAKNILDEVLSGLDSRESAILSMYFGLNSEKPLSCRAIGEDIGLSRERVRQIQSKSLKKLRHRLGVLRHRELCQAGL